MFRLAFKHEEAEGKIGYQSATKMWIRSRKTRKVFFASSHFLCAFLNYKTWGKISIVVSNRRWAPFQGNMNHIIHLGCEVLFT